MRREEGSFLSASPWKRILVVIAGPLANLVFAVLVLSLIWWVGFSTYSWPSRVIIASDYTSPDSETVYPAESAGFESGDIIISMNGASVESFWDITEVILRNPDERILCEVERPGPNDRRRLEISVTPRIDEETGEPVIGIHSWIEPVVGSVEPASAASTAGLLPGDRILSVNGTGIRHTIDYDTILGATTGVASIGLAREDQRLSLEMSTENGSSGGISWRYSEYRSPRIGLFASLGKGAAQSFDLMRQTVQGIGRILQFRFKGMQVAGAIRMTQIMGEAATTGFSFGVDTGIVSFLRILGFISVAIALAQLLPIPILDGGQLVLNLLEVVRRKPLAPKFIYRFQLVGFFLVLLILAATVMSDILSFVR